MQSAKPVSAALLLLIGGCDDRQVQSDTLNLQWNAVAQSADIDQLKRQVAGLQRQDAFEDNEIVALAKANDALQKQVNDNANIATANDKIDDARWNVMRQRLGL